MPRPRPPHLHKETTRHGAVVWYVRVGKGTRIRIRGDYGSAEFLAAYEPAVKGGGEARRSKPDATSLAWLIARYRDSGAWAALSPATRRQKDNFFKGIIASAGDVPYKAVTRAKIAEAVDARSKTPFLANNFLNALRGLFGWALGAGLVDADPTQGVRVKRPKTAGFPVWTEDDMRRFETRWPIGTRERLAFAILIYTGLRRGDVARLGRQHIRNGVISLQTEKTGEWVHIRVLPALAEIIAKSQTGDLALVATRDGRPMVKEAFGTWFGEACRAAGLANRNAHGLRKAAATRAAEAGATVNELEALFGWRGGGMAARYTRAADRKRLASAASDKLAGRNESSAPIPAPDGEAPAPEKIRK